MKRDMELVRAILIAAEERSEEQGYDQFLLDGHDSTVVNQHVELMKEAGLLDARIMRADGTGILMVRVFRLHWEGHDFLVAIRNDTIWAKTKKRLAETGVGWTFELVKTTAILLGKQALGLS